jgi:glycosyltransferase involved in cell wall biosynthesis
MEHVVNQRRIAYVSLQAVVEGQDTWAAVNEIVKGIEAAGWTVDTYFPKYGDTPQPSVAKRLLQMRSIQNRLAGELDKYDALYVRAHPMARRISLLAYRKGIPVVQECNGPYEDLFIAHPLARIGRSFFEYLQRSQYRRASAVVSVAQGLSDWLVHETGNRRVFTNGNGANTEVFTPEAQRYSGLPEKFAVFFGQFAAWQGISTLLQATTLDEWPDGLCLVFVGHGAMRAQVERAASAAPDRVMYLGRILYGQVAQVVSHAVVAYVPIVMPENELMHSPLKLYESMACGVPVIASDTMGISEVVTENECGLLVTAGDAAGIVHATQRLLEDPAMAAEMGRRGREAVVAKYSWAARAEQRLEIIEAAIERARAREPAAASQ